MFVLRDISERLAAEASILERDARLTPLFEEAIIVASHTSGAGEGSVIDFNQPAMKLLGRTREQMLGLKYRDFIDPLELASRPPDFDALLKGSVISTSRTVVTPAGERVPVNVRIKSTPQERSMIVFRDVSEQMRTEEQLRQSQRLESLGLMAGGIAHDFNNVPAAIMGNAGFLQLTLGKDDSGDEAAAEIEQAAQSGAALVSRMLAFGRRQELAPRVVDLGEALPEFLKMGRAVVGKPVAMFAPARALPGVQEPQSAAANRL